MTNPENRELSTQLYRWLERYERIPNTADQDAIIQMFTAAWKELEAIQTAHNGTPWALGLCIGYYQALEAVYKASVSAS